LVLADEPGIWRKTDEVNEITPALTEGTTTFKDDEGSEFVHEVQSWAGPNFPTALDALNWVHSNIAYVEDDVNYKVVEAWANPEQTLDQGSGDSEDMAFLLASLLKFHTDEVDEDDLVYAVCGFVFPPVDGFHAWVYWYDASAIAWHQLDPTIPAMNGLLYPALGTLWLNDEHVWGFLPGYYPGPLPPVAGYDREDFAKIAEGGFGDPINNYSWSMTYFNGDLYVGTGRNVPYMVGQLLKATGFIPPDFKFEYITHPREPIQSQEWAEDMRAEIWRHSSWEQVYQSPVLQLEEHTFVPGEWGFRQMVTFTDRTGEEAIYAASGGGFLPGRLLLKSTDGNTWEQVVTPPEMGADSRAMVVHNGKLYIGTGGTLLSGGEAEVWASDCPSTVIDNWELVADFTLDDVGNSSVVSLESFNGYLYAGTQNLESGYQVFRSNAQAPNHPQLGQWTRIVEYGGGDMMNYWAGTMEVFNNKLYVGSMSLPLVMDGPVKPGPPKGFELIRINPDDSWELVIGDYVPWIPPAGPTFRLPRSGWPGGFGNFLNFYCWSLQEDNGVLYLGTFDASSFLRFLPVEELAELIDLTPEQQAQIVAALEQVIGLLEGLGISEDYIEPFRRLLEAFESDPIDWEAVWQVFTDGRFAGGDLWKTEDGVWWKPVTLNGFDNPDNYGVRNMIHVNPLVVGMANPFQGCEVWKAAFTMTVNKAGSETGTVTSDPAGIFCGADCTETYGYGTVVTLTAHPSVKSYFVRWSGDCSGTGLTTQVTMDANKTCIATFSYPVGGIVVPVNKLGLVALRLGPSTLLRTSSGQAPWLGLAALASLAALTIALVRRRRSA
jgi:hypothetical protein